METVKNLNQTSDTISAQDFKPDTSCVMFVQRGERCFPPNTYQNPRQATGDRAVTSAMAVYGSKAGSHDQLAA